MMPIPPQTPPLPTGMPFLPQTPYPSYYPPAESLKNTLLPMMGPLKTLLGRGPILRRSYRDQTSSGKHLRDQEDVCMGFRPPGVEVFEPILKSCFSRAPPEAMSFRTHIELDSGHWNFFNS